MDHIPETEQMHEGHRDVWSYKGYRLRPGEFTTAMVHMYRAEVQRANVWRQRLDTTTNWAVVSTGAVITFAFSQAQGHHTAILLTLLLVTLFLFIESRRYRYYELWSYRVRLMETEFFAAMLTAPFHPNDRWAENLSQNLRKPSFPVSQWEALGRRLRRNYLAIYAILLIAWLIKLWLMPEQAASWSGLLERAEIGGISGWVVFTVVFFFYAVTVLIAWKTAGLTDASGEIFY